MIDKIKEWFPSDDLETVPGFDLAIIGIDDSNMKIIYSVSKCIDILKEVMEDEEAVEYFNHNIKQIYIGDKTPIWCVDDL